MITKDNAIDQSGKSPQELFTAGSISRARLETLILGQALRGGFTGAFNELTRHCIDLNEFDPQLIELMLRTAASKTNVEVGSIARGIENGVDYSIWSQIEPGWNGVYGQWQSRPDVNGKSHFLLFSAGVGDIAKLPENSHLVGPSVALSLDGRNHFFTGASAPIGLCLTGECIGVFQRPLFNAETINDLRDEISQAELSCRMQNNPLGN